MRQETKLTGLARNPAAPASVLVRIVGSETDAAYWAATRDGLPDEVYDALATHDDRRVRELLADHSFAPGVQRARLAGDPDRRVRRAVAAGPDGFRMTHDPLPAETYERLSTDEDRVVRLRVAQGWDAAPAEVLDRMLDDPEPQVRKAAVLRSWRRRPELVEEALGYGDWDALEHAPMDAEHARRVLRDGDYGKCQAVAANPHLPADFVDEMGRHPEAVVRLTVSMRPELTEEQRAAIDYEVRPESRITPASWAYAATDEALMRRAATSAHLGLRRSAACNKRLPGDLVELLAADEDFAVRLLLCERHADAPADLLWTVYREALVITRGALLDHRNFPLHRLAGLAGSDDPKERAEALNDPRAERALVDRLSADPEDRVRAAAAAHPMLSPGRLPGLLADPRTASSAARNPNLPLAVMEEILTEAGIA